MLSFLRQKVVSEEPIKHTISRGTSTLFIGIIRLNNSGIGIIFISELDFLMYNAGLKTKVFHLSGEELLS